MAAIVLTIRDAPPGATPSRRSLRLSSGVARLGRGPDNEWVLADPEKSVSKHHAVVRAAGGRFTVEDTRSTNGTAAGSPPRRLPPETPVPLADGDTIQVGGYAIEVRLEGAAAAVPADPVTVLGDPEPDAPPAVGYGHFDRVRAAAAPGSGLPNVIPDDDPFARPDPYPREIDRMAPERPDALDPLAEFDRPEPAAERRQAFDPLLDEFEPGRDRGFRPGAPDRPADELLGDPSGRRDDPWRGASEADHLPAERQAFRPPQAIIPDDFDAEVRGPGTGAPSPPPLIPTPPRPATLAPPPPPRPAAVPPEPMPQPAAIPQPLAAVGDAGALLAAFYAGAGLPVPPEAQADPQAALERCGRLIQALVAGLRDNLAARSTIKNEFRIERTMVSTRDNNPVKLAPDAGQALAAVLGPPAPGYLDGEAAVAEGFRDLQAHQLAVMAGVQVALASVLKRFDPESLVERVDSNGKSGGLLGGSRKSRYWEVFVALYGDTAREVEDDFQAVFGRAFARAYEEQEGSL